MERVNVKRADLIKQKTIANCHFYYECGLLKLSVVPYLDLKTMSYMCQIYFSVSLKKVAG